jgi:glycosyltransferase involved in cell wall biosynthesis
MSVPEQGHRILYVTFDGVLQPLGFSQVVRVIAALAQRGFPYGLLSVERKSDLADGDKVRRLERLLGEVEIPWTPVGVDLGGSARRVAEAFARVTGAAAAIVGRQRTSLVHARGYQAAAIANAIGRIKAVPYLFDARGCWIDERPDWFGYSTAYAVGKFVERNLYEGAKAVVTLTELHAGDVIDGAFGKKDRRVVETIPTCADYGEFAILPNRPAKPEGSSVVPPDVQLRLRDRIVISIVGALNRSYLPEQTLALFKYARELNPLVHLLVLTQQQREYGKQLAAAGIPAEDVTLASATHEDMPTWLSWIDFGLLLLADTIAKRGSMPTKLAEFFAAGVRPVAHACNSEMASWVRRAGSGVLLETTKDEDLRRAAYEIATSSANVTDLRRARDLTAPHFSLSSGVERYAGLLDRVLR